MHKKAVGCFPFSFFHNFISRYSSYITWQMTFEVMGCICFLLLFFYLYVLLPFLSLFGHFTYTNQIRQYVCVCVCVCRFLVVRVSLAFQRSLSLQRKILSAAFECSFIFLVLFFVASFGHFSLGRTKYGSVLPFYSLLFFVLPKMV